MEPKQPAAWQYELATGKDKDSNLYTGWQLHLSPYRPNVPERSIRNLKALYPCEPGSVVFDPAEVEYLAARVRRLCAHFDYPVPDKDDAFIAGVTPALIGSLLTKHEVDARHRVAPPASEHSEIEQMQRDIDEAYPTHDRINCDDSNLYNAPTLLLSARCGRCTALDHLQRLKQKVALADAAEILLKISRMGIPAGEAAASAQDALTRIDLLLAKRSKP